MGYDYATAAPSSGSSLGDVADILGSVESLASLATAGIGLTLLIIGAIISAVVAIALYIFHAIPVYSMAKKLGMKYAWLAWVPICHDLCRLYLLSEMAGDKPCDPGIGNFKIANRRMSFLYYVLIKWLGAAVVGIVVSIASMILPIVGSVSAILGLLPAAACGVLEYVYLRDVLNLYKEDTKSNQTTAIVITAIEAVLGIDFVKSGYLYTLMKKEPLAIVGEEIPVEEPVEATPAE